MNVEAHTASTPIEPDRIPTEVKPGILYTTFHFPEALVNRVTSSECDEDTMGPEYKVVAVDVERVAEESQASRVTGRLSPAGIYLRRAHCVAFGCLSRHL